jgi:hypothetical protein
MSRDYSVYMTLGLPFIQKNVQFIVQKADDLNFVYLADSDDNKLFDISTRYLNVNQAVSKLFTMAEKMTDYESPFLRAKYCDTDFFLRLYEAENKAISIGVAVFGFRWDKKFEQGSSSYTIDFARYIRLLLSVCNDLTILEVETHSDLVEGVQYIDQGCVTGLICMGPFEEAFSGSLEGVNASFGGLIYNGFGNKFIFFDENTGNSIEPSAQGYYEIFKAGFPVYLYAKKDGVSFKIAIKRNIQEYEYDFVSVYPLAPYRMKKGYGSEGEKIDVAFYTQRLLELCENFAIYELKTFF